MNDEEYFKFNQTELYKIFGGAMALTFIGGQVLSVHKNKRGGFTVQWKAHASNGANRMTLTLNGGDLLDIEFGKFRAGKYTVIETIEDVYAEDFGRIWWDKTLLARSFKG